MNEARRTAYLDALGIPQFLPRLPLPGARPSSRTLQSIVEVQPEPVVKAAAESAGLTPAERDGKPVTELRDVLAETRPAPGSAIAERGVQRAEPSVATASDSATTQRSERCSLILLRTGNVCWIDELASGADTQQLQLIRSLAQALGLPLGAGVAAEILHWPPQQTAGMVAAGSAGDFVASRLSREVAHDAELSLVAMGGRCQLWCGEVDGFRVLATVGSAEMLSQPLLKRQAWRDLYGRVGV